MNFRIQHRGFGGQVPSKEMLRCCLSVLGREGLQVPMADWLAFSVKLGQVLVPASGSL